MQGLLGCIVTEDYDINENIYVVCEINKLKIPSCKIIEIFHYMRMRK